MLTAFNRYTVVTGYGLDVPNSIAGIGKIFFLSLGYGAYSAYYPMGTSGTFPVQKQLYLFYLLSALSGTTESVHTKEAYLGRNYTSISRRMVKIS